nr:MAG TPA: hypothetical protein [Bacteriophage sp.]DAR18246.1 MAG TPA: hypothetical protein [Bacteriophage sp.]
MVCSRCLGTSMPANPTFGDDRMIRSCPSRFSGVGHRRKTVALSFRSRLAAKLCLLASAHYIAHSQCQFAHCRALESESRRNRVFGKRAMLCGEVRRALLFANRCGTMPDLSAFGHFDEVQFEKAAVGIVFVHCCFDVDVLSFAHEGGNADRTVVEIAPDDSFESETKGIIIQLTCHEYRLRRIRVHACCGVHRSRLCGRRRGKHRTYPQDDRRDSDSC